MPKPCKECGGLNHSRFLCPHRPRSVLRKIGKAQKKTNTAVARWKRSQKPNPQGYFVCYICGRWVTYLMAEHGQSKARHPDRRTDLSNLRPVCEPCNKSKGSHDAEVDNGTERPRPGGQRAISSYSVLKTPPDM